MARRIRRDVEKRQWYFDRTISVLALITGIAVNIG